MYILMYVCMYICPGREKDEYPSLALKFATKKASNLLVAILPILKFINKVYFQYLKGGLQFKHN